MPDHHCLRSRDLHHGGPCHPQDLWPDGGGCDCEPGAVPVWPFPHSAGGLHLRPRHIHHHQSGLLPWPAAVQQVGVHRPGDGLGSSDAVPDLLGDLREGAAPPRVQQAVHRPAPAIPGGRQAGPNRTARLMTAFPCLCILLASGFRNVDRRTLDCWLLADFRSRGLCAFSY